MNLENNYINQLKFISIILLSIYCISKVGYGIQDMDKSVYVATRLITNLAFPILLMVFGALALNKDMGLLSTVKKAYKLLIPSFIFWNIILAVLILIYRGFGTFPTRITTYTWFAWIIVSNVLVIPILNEFIRSEGETGLKYILSIFLITSILWSLSVQFNFSLYYIDLVFFAEPLCFMVLGYYLANKKFTCNSHKIFAISAIVFIAALVIRLYLVDIRFNNWNSYFIPIFKEFMQLSVDPFTIIEASALFLMFKTGFGKYLSKSKLVSFYSEISFSSILTLSIFCLILSIYPFTDNWINLTIIGVIVFLILNGIISFVLSKIPVLKKVIA